MNRGNHMSELKNRDKWLMSLKEELSRYFSENEKEEIISYYEEMIDDRLDQGESIEHILDDYDAKKIAKYMIPEVISKRKQTEKTTSDNAWLIALLLFSTPILIPLGVVYLSLMVVAISLIFSGIAVMVSGVGAVIVQVIRGVTLGLAFPELLVSIGVSLLALVVCLAVGYWLVKVSWWLIQQLAIWFSRLIIRKREEHENH